MGAAKKLLDKKVLKELVPLNALSAVHLDEISRKVIIETVRSGRYVFKAGDRDYHSVYLLEGKVELIEGGRDVVSSIVGGSEAARHPLAHKQPRQLSVRATGNVTVARVDSSLLDVLLTWDESSGYDVVELGPEDDGDWMTRMLQSQAFMQLPPSNIHQLLMRLDAVSVQAGDVVVKQDEDGDYFYIVKSGRMAVSRKASARGKEVMLAELGEGACFGEEALVSGTRRNATVTMLTDGSLMRLSKDDFNELLRTPLVHEVDYAQANKLAGEGAVWLDVRLPGEFSNQYINGSRNLPLSALREQADTLDSDSRYIVCCDTGRRSASGAFILGQRGLDVYTLRNGLMDVPDDVLNGILDEQKAGATVHDADILPFENDNAADAAESGSSRQSSSGSDDLSEQLRASEAACSEQRAEAETLSQRIESLENELRDSVTQHDELVQQLEDATQARNSTAEMGEDFEKQRVQLELELARVREDYQQLGQRTSAVAVERDAASRELEKVRGELEDLKARLDSQQGEISEQVSVLQGQLDARASELEEAINRRGEIEASLADAKKIASEAADREIELAAQIDALVQQSDEQQKHLQGDFQAEKTKLEQQLQALQGNIEDYEQKLTLESGEREALTGKLVDVEQQLAQSQATEQSMSASLEQARQQAEEAGQRIRAELQGEQDALSEKIAALKDAVAGQDQLTAQLREHEQALIDSEQGREALQQQLEEKVRETDELRQSLDGAKGEFDELKAQSGDSAGREDQLTRRIAELEQQLASREKEYESDLGSAREAMTRAQTEVENLKREQQRLLNRQRKAEETLSRERHDHENEVHRLHKEMKAAAGGSSEGLAAELEALQAQVSEAAKLRDDMDVQLGERSAQLEDVQERAEQLDQQLKLAQQSAREAEQQLVEANRSANEEMEIRLDTEHGIQHGLREALEKSEKERNDHQEKITVINQELEDLREAYQQSKQALEGNENAVSRLAEVESRLDVVQVERDELLSSVDALKNELDQLRAEAEVHRGLEGMSSDGDTDIAESEALQQAKQNVEMAVRLRSQAEEQVQSLNREVEQLKAQLNSASESRAPVMTPVDGAIPSLDDNDPYASNPMLSDVPDLECVNPAESGVLLDEDMASEPPVPAQAAKSGLMKGLLAGLVVAAAAGAGLFWWNNGPGQVSPPVAVEKNTGGKTAETVPPVKPAKQTKPRAIDSQNVAKVAVPDKPSVASITSVVNGSSGPSEASRSVSGVAAISNASRTFPLAKGMPDIPRSGVDSKGKVEDSQVPDETRKAAPVMQATNIESETSKPVVEPASELPVEQPVGTFRDRLSDGSSGPTMVRFRADRFLMGSGTVSQQFDERPQHDVRLNAFAIGAHEITFNEYDTFARATGRRLPADNGWGRATWPVINVSWEDARAYTQWLSAQTGARYRLPTEAEWEFVARSGTATRYWWGEEAGEAHGNCFDCGSDDGGVQTSRVGSFAASPWGVYDMAGNAREWVRDCYVPNYSRAPVDGRAVEFGGCADRVVRGGAYSSPSAQLRSASRDRMEAQSRLDNLGFRVVREY